MELLLDAAGSDSHLVEISLRLSSPGDGLVINLRPEPIVLVRESAKTCTIHSPEPPIILPRLPLTAAPSS